MPQNERADSQGSMKFMRRDGHCIDAQLAKVNWNLADGLHSVGMQLRPPVTTGFRDCLNGLLDSCFIVGKHQTYQAWRESSQVGKRKANHAIAGDISRKFYIPA